MLEKRRETTQEEDDDEVEEDVTIPEVINALKIVRKFSQKNNLIKEVNALRAIENKCFSDTVSNKKQLSIKSFFNLL